MLDTAIHRDEVFSPDRDELFLARLCEHIQMLENIGMSKENIRRTLGTFDYVRVWVNTPTFLYPVLKLPKGYTWKMGESHKTCVGETFTLLPIGKDLYIRGIEVPGTHIHDPKFGYIKDYKKLNGSDVANRLDILGLDCVIMDFYHKNGLKLGFIQEITRPLNIADEWIKIYRMVKGGDINV